MLCFLFELATVAMGLLPHAAFEVCLAMDDERRMHLENVFLEHMAGNYTNLRWLHF